MRILLVLSFVFVVSPAVADPNAGDPDLNSAVSSTRGQTWFELSPEFTAAAATAFRAHSDWRALQGAEDPLGPRRVYAVIEADGSFHFHFLPNSSEVRDGGVVYVVDANTYLLRCQYFPPARGCSE